MRFGTLTVACLALAVGAARGDSPGPVAHERRTTENEVLHAIQEDGRRTVESLTAVLVSLPPGPEQQRVQTDVIAAKLDTRERLLRRIASFATARGDLREAGEAERALEALRAPAIRTAAVSPATKEGGAR